MPENEVHLHASNFNEVVAPLERRRPLTGPGRARCMRAFNEAPDGFRMLAADALQRAQQNPLGLLVRMVTDGDHLLARPNANGTDPREAHMAKLRAGVNPFTDEPLGRPAAPGDALAAAGGGINDSCMGCGAETTVFDNGRSLLCADCIRSTPGPPTRVEPDDRFLPDGETF